MSSRRAEATIAVTRQRRQTSADSGQRRYPRTTWCSFMLPPADYFRRLISWRLAYLGTNWQPILRTPASLGLLGNADVGVRVGYQPTVVVVGTGVEPVTARSIVWCSAIELSVTTSSSSESMSGTHRPESITMDRGAAGPDDIGTLLRRDAGGSRTR